MILSDGAGELIMLGIVPKPFNPKIEAPMSAAEKVARS